jgi:hypothetical protein
LLRFFRNPEAARLVQGVEVPVSKEGKEIKITDKRMFTPDGKLREEYRFLDEKSTTAPLAPPADTGSEPPENQPATAAGSSAAGRSGAQPRPSSAGSTTGAPAGREASGAASRREPPPPPAGEPGARLEFPSTPPGLGPSFYDLAALLAEPIQIYLGDLELPDGQSAENLEMARLYIDLLDVLRQKTAGNLTAQESAFLEDLLYRMRVRYVQKHG